MSTELDGMRERISEEIDRPLFDEAADCVNAGAYRAAYVMSWIAAAESLRNKFSIMANRNDGQAGRVLKDVEDREKKDVATDAYLLDQARVLGLVTEEQHKRLAHVREMRNLYAHPRSSAPTERGVLAALEVAVDAVLSQPPLLRHGYANRLLSDLFDDRHFLEDEEMVVLEYAADVARRLHPDVHPYVLAGLVARSQEVAGQRDLAKVRRRGGWFTVAFVSELEPDLAEERWRTVEVVQERPAVASALLGVPEVWPFLPPQARAMIAGHLVDPVKDRTGMTVSKAFGLRRARSLDSEGMLTSGQRKALRAAVEVAPYPILREAGVPLLRYAERLIGDLASHSWDRQNPAARAVEEADSDEVESLAPDLQERLGRNVLQAAEGRAWRAQQLLEFVGIFPGTWPGRFVAGLLFETLVNEKGAFRLKGSWFREVVGIALAHKEAETLIESLAGRVRGSGPKNDLVFGTYERGDDAYDEAMIMLQEIREAVERPGLVYKLISELRTARGNALDDHFDGSSV